MGRALAIALLLLAGCGEPAPVAAPPAPRGAPTVAEHEVQAAVEDWDVAPSGGFVVDCTTPHVDCWKGALRVSVRSARDRTPVAGAFVRVEPGRGSHEGAREAVTDATGVASVSRWSGDFVLVVRRRGFLVARVEPALASDPEMTEVELVPGDALEGRVVVADTGSPAAEASVIVWTSEFGGGYVDSGEETFAVTADGRFEIPGVVSDQPVHVAAIAPGFAPIEAVSAPGERASPMTLELGRGATVTGTVRTASTAADVSVAHAWLTAARQDAELRLDDDFLTPRERHAVATAPTCAVDAGGGYRIRGVAPGAYVPLARIGRGPDAVLGRGAAIEVRDAADVTGADVVLHVPARIAIEVVRADGTALTSDEARVCLDGDWGDVPDEAKADFDDGDRRWHLRGMSPGLHHVFVDPSRGLTAAWVPVDVADGESRELTVVLGRGRALRGEVRDESGAGIAEACVSFSAPVAADAPTARVEVTTDEMGRFELHGVNAAEGHVYVYAKGFLPREFDGVRDTETLPPVTLTRAARIVCSLPSSALGRSVEEGFRQGERGAGSGAVATDDSRVEWGGLVPGEPAVVYLREEGRAAFVSPWITLAPGETRDLGEIVFPQGVAIEGVVTDADGRPLHGAQVRGADMWVRSQALTDAQGRFRLAELPPGATWVWVRADGWPRTLVQIVPGEKTSAEIRLTRGGVLVGTVSKKGGGSLPKGHVDAIRLDLPGRQEIQTLAVDGLGRFREALQPGRYRIGFDGPSGSAAASPPEVTIREGDEVGVAIALLE